jgi:hypothetical protein
MPSHIAQHTPKHARTHTKTCIHTHLNVGGHACSHTLHSTQKNTRTPTPKHAYTHLNVGGHACSHTLHRTQKTRAHPHQNMHTRTSMWVAMRAVRCCTARALLALRASWLACMVKYKSGGATNILGTHIDRYRAAAYNQCCC